MEFEDFKPLFHESWHNKIRPWVESEDCDRVYKHLKNLSRRGKKIAPLSSDTFRCFLETPYDDLKVIIMGNSPYYTYWNDKPIADGLLMGCSITDRLQPSLIQFYKGIMKEFDYGYNDVIQSTDLRYLARQGVLLFNASLTVEKDKPDSHLKLWEPFTRFILERVVDVSGAPVILLGKEVAKFERWLAPFTWSFKLSHPASAAYQHRDWDSEKVFTNISKILKENNNTEIKWIKTK